MFGIENYLSDGEIKKICEKKEPCLNCQNIKTIKIIKGKYTTFQCLCGTNIFYPENRERDTGVNVFVSQLEYKINQIIKLNKTKIKNYEQYLEFYEKVLVAPDFNFIHESRRFYQRYINRENFTHARIFGKIGQKN